MQHTIQYLCSQIETGFIFMLLRKAYIFKEDAENYYKEGRASGKQMSITS